MSNVIMYDIWIFTFICLCTDNFLPQRACLYRTILPAAFYNHCLLFECTYHALMVCHMKLHIAHGSLDYELLPSATHIDKTRVVSFKYLWPKRILSEKWLQQVAVKLYWPTRPWPNRCSLFSHRVSVHMYVRLSQKQKLATPLTLVPGK